MIIVRIMIIIMIITIIDSPSNSGGQKDRLAREPAAAC